MVKADPAVVADIIGLTGGHPGLLATCYQYLDGTIAKNEPDGTVQWATWLQYRHNLLTDTPVLGWWLHMIAPLQRATAAAAARQLLPLYLRSPGSVSITDNQEPAARVLVATGVLQAPGRVWTDIGGRDSVERMEFAVTFPLMRSLLMTHVMPLLRRPVPCEPPPLADGVLDMRVLLLNALRYMNRTEMTSALAKSSERACGIRLSC